MTTGSQPSGNRKERRAAAKQSRAAAGRDEAAGRFAEIERAVAMVSAGDLAGAEALLEAIHRKAPGDAEANHQLGMIYVRTGRAEAGLDLIRQAVEALPMESLYWNNLSAACLAIERSQDAIDAARKALEIDRNNFKAWQNLGYGLRDLRDQAGAVEAFEKAEKLGAIDISGLATWAECLGGLRRFEEAERVVRKALALAPGDPAVLTVLGWLQMEQQQDALARDTLKRSLSLKPEQFLAAFNYGILSLRIDEVETGLRWLRRATSIEPKNAGAWHVLALELARHGLTEEALPVAERCLRLSPEDHAIEALVHRLKRGGTETDDVVSFDFEESVPIGPDFGVKPEAETETDDDGVPVIDFSVLQIGGDKS
jgi:tetratricopeptide (TPR) repeat protein